MFTNLPRLPWIIAKRGEERNDRNASINMSSSKETERKKKKGQTLFADFTTFQGLAPPTLRLICSSSTSS